MSHHQLTQEDRYQIQGWVKSRTSIREMAKVLGCSPSTVSREIQRNKCTSGYFCQSAQRKYLERRACVHPPKRMTGLLSTVVRNYLENEQWSPQQIHHRLLNEKITVATETIYKFVYDDFKNGGALYLNLRRGRKFRRTRKALKGLKRCGMRLSYPSIKNRPEIVETRERVGDLERDTILGKVKGPVLLVIVDRSSRFTVMGRMGWLNAETTHKKTVELLQTFTVHTITNDNGPEFAGFKETESKLNAQVFFNDPYASWQRGTCENTNGLIRQYFPKGTDFNKVTDQQVSILQDKLNNRPRKCLGYKTPLEVQRMKSQGVALRLRI